MKLMDTYGTHGNSGLPVSLQIEFMRWEAFWPFPAFPHPLLSQS